MLNKVMLIGNVGKDPEVRYFDNGVAKAQFSLATTESYKNKEGQKTELTEWHNVVIWRGLAEVVEKYVKKGDKLFIEGKVKTRSYDDKDGNKKYITEIVADNMSMLGGRKSDGTDSGQTTNEPAADYHADAPHEGDDLPF
ncbi:MAG: single-stranded DNA-binding protein [Bacteroidales bacterium]|nr:single-stranded DNA-binding protein [Bacteroidales bacterium]MCF8455953.1 single-stranded DNA-binding protein [Bacteroidales bacterium]